MMSMHCLFSTVTTLQDRIAELELRISKSNEIQRRLERVESRLGINEMLNLIDRNRALEERIHALELEKSKKSDTAEK